MNVVVPRMIIRLQCRTRATLVQQTREDSSLLFDYTKYITLSYYFFFYRTYRFLSSFAVLVQRTLPRMPLGAFGVHPPPTRVMYPVRPLQAVLRLHPYLSPSCLWHKEDLVFVDWYGFCDSVYLGRIQRSFGFKGVGSRSWEGRVMGREVI